MIMNQRLMIQDYKDSIFIRTFEETGRLGNQESYIHIPDKHMVINVCSRNSI